MIDFLDTAIAAVALVTLLGEPAAVVDEIETVIIEGEWVDVEPAVKENEIDVLELIQLFHDDPPKIVQRQQGESEAGEW